MGIETVPHRPYSRDLAPCDFWLLPKLRGCRYETIEEIKEALTKVIDMLTQEDFHGVFQKVLEQHNKCIAARGDYFEGDLSFICVQSIKVPIRKKSGNLSYVPRISIVLCDRQQLWKAEITGDTVTRLSIPIRGRGKSPEEGQRWNLAET